MHLGSKDTPPAAAGFRPADIAQALGAAGFRVVERYGLSRFGVDPAVGKHDEAAGSATGTR